MKKNDILALAALIFAVVANSFAANAIPVPQGVEGVIFELDGLTQVRSGIDFFALNEASGYVILGKTGHGSSGRYSVSMKGNTGDPITIKAWNKYNQVNATILLNGVMKDVNLFLNMTYPPYAPNITSIANEAAIEDQIYMYQVQAFDENEEDTISYSIIKGPNGSSIDNLGLLTWLPDNDDVGYNEITIQVTDGQFYSNQSFVLYVQNVNDEVVINSTPPTEAKVGSTYIYDLDAYDIDNELLSYFLVIFPEGMTIEASSGLILWKPKGNQKGAGKVVVGVSDGFSIMHQEFTINAYASETEESKPGGSSSGGGSGGSGGGGGGGGGGGAPSAALLKNMQGGSKSLVAVKLPVNGAEVKIEDLSERPKDAKRISRKVYRYLIIENVKQIKINNTEGARITFSVDRKWLYDNQIEPSEIIMTRYHNNTWQDLETVNASSDSDFIHYEATTPGFSYFAISVKEGVATANNLRPISSKIQAPFRFTGKVFNFLMQGPVTTTKKIFFENLDSGKIFVAQIGEGQFIGEYYLFLEGNDNDRIKITVEGTKGEHITALKDAQLDFVMNFKETRFVPINGNSFFAAIRASPVVSSVAAVSLLASLIGFRFYRISKRLKN